jgi:hypothetical protein
VTNTIYTHRVPRRRTKVSGRLGPGLLAPGPARIVGTVQRAGVHTPVDCIHCHAMPPNWVTDGYSAHCRVCGATWYRAVHTYQLPRPPRRLRPVWLPGVKLRTRGEEKGDDT